MKCSGQSPGSLDLKLSALYGCETSNLVMCNIYDFNVSFKYFRDMQDVGKLLMGLVPVLHRCQILSWYYFDASC